MAEYGGGEGGNGDGELDCPTGVCVDGLGNIIICDQNNNRLVLLDSSGKYLCVLIEGAHNVERPTAVAINPYKQLVVAQEDGIIKTFTYLKSQ